MYIDLSFMSSAKIGGVVGKGTAIKKQGLSALRLRRKKPMNLKKPIGLDEKQVVTITLSE